MCFFFLFEMRKKMMARNDILFKIFKLSDDTIFQIMCCTTICICDSNLKQNNIKKYEKRKSKQIKSIERKEINRCLVYIHIYFSISFQKEKQNKIC